MHPPAPAASLVAVFKLSVYEYDLEAMQAAFPALADGECALHAMRCDAMRWAEALWTVAACLSASEGDGDQ